MTTVMKTSREVRGIGVSIPRFDSPEKVTGRTQYVGDVQLAGLLQPGLQQSRTRTRAFAVLTRLERARCRACARS